MITKLSKDNSNKSNNEYHNLESIFEKFILCTIYQLARNLVTRSKNRNIHSRFFVQFISECRPSASVVFQLAS